MQQVYDLIKSQAGLIYPAGGMANDFANSIEFESLNVIAFVDQDEDKWSQMIKGFEIVDPNEIGTLNPDAIVVAASAGNRRAFTQISLSLIWVKSKYFNVGFAVSRKGLAVSN